MEPCADLVIPVQLASKHKGSGSAECTHRRYVAMVRFSWLRTAPRFVKYNMMRLMHRQEERLTLIAFRCRVCSQGGKPGKCKV